MGFRLSATKKEKGTHHSYLPQLHQTGIHAGEDGQLLIRAFADLKWFFHRHKKDSLAAVLFAVCVRREKKHASGWETPLLILTIPINFF